MTLHFFDASLTGGTDSMNSFIYLFTLITSSEKSVKVPRITVLALSINLCVLDVQTIL